MRSKNKKKREGFHKGRRGEEVGEEGEIRKNRKNEEEHCAPARWVTINKVFHFPFSDFADFLWGLLALHMGSFLTDSSWQRAPGNLAWKESIERGRRVYGIETIGTDRENLKI